MIKQAPLRILQLVPEPLPSYRADVTVLFGKYLSRNGVACDIVGKAADDAPMPEQGFASVRRATARGRRWQREWDFLKLCLHSVRHARHSDYDVIQVRDMVSIGLATLLLARWKKIPFTYWVSFLMCDGRIERARAELAIRPRLYYYLALGKGLLEKQLFYKVLLPRAQHVFVQSEAMKAHMVARGIAPERLTAVPMGVDMETLRGSVPSAAPAAVAATAGTARPHPPTLAYLGTLDRSRQLPLVLDALALVRRRYPTARLLLIGSSPTPSDLDELRAHAARIGVSEAVTFTGWLPSAEAQALVADADAAVSYIPRGKLFDVSSPTKLLEYMALGIPAIGNDTPDQLQVLSASGAGWLTASTAEAIAEAFTAILDAPAAARQRAAGGRAWIEAHRSYRVIADALSQTYHAIARAAP
ncbi:glycosyltransferase family 4 protein [Duganella sp. LX20W]|uniref:Glycosyltransferase family 4 protein n=1 Tax=Rugamonas brunnea TaxID=2758569 RepID=A0A7W2IBH2_9BURK|nr:glycosyltransferase family 4 protein [Rugamonas brunnea]MBA5637140.1 glycosyltransferase family 4 protein [Rugamonas brunnea]